MSGHVHVVVGKLLRFKEIKTRSGTAAVLVQLVGKLLRFKEIKTPKRIFVRSLRSLSESCSALRRLRLHI